MQCFATTIFAQAPSSKADERVEKIRKELNEFKIPAALQHLGELLQKYPNDAYLNELQISIRLQIMERILYARSETGVEELSFLKRDTSWQNKQVVSWDDTLNTTEKQDDVVVKSEIKKAKASLDVWDDFTSTENANVYIDSSIINDVEYQRNLKLNEPESVDEFKDIKSNAQRKKERQVARELKLEAKRQAVLQGYSNLSYDAFKQEILQLSALSTLRIEQADSASACLRRWSVDSVFFNKKVNTQAQEFIEKAAEDEAEDAVENALVNYNEALTIEPALYFVYLKMANLYATVEEDSMALLYYDAAKDLEKEKPDAYYSNAIYYFVKAEYELALENVLEAIMRYPERKYYHLLEEIHERKAKVYTSNWMPREVFPIVSAQNMDAIVVDDKSPWYWYQAARMHVQDYLNLDGTLRTNDSTREKYLEVYAWEKMLDSCHDQNKFAFARAMRKIGYLDCYVFLTEYHHYLYPQFKVFAAENRKKMEAYFLILLGWEKPKFDKIRPKPVLVKKQKK